MRMITEMHGGKLIRRTLAVAWTLLLVAGAPAQTPQAAPLIDAIAVQSALDREGFSPGLIDGKIGRKTQLALRTFQEFRGLPTSGECDAATTQALRIGASPTTAYTLTAADLAEVGGPIPDDWNKRAALDRMRYDSLAALLAERGHCSRALVETLNPGVTIASLKPGARVTLPIVTPQRTDIAVESLEVDLGEKLIRARDARGRVVALFHCSIAAFAEKRPSGDAEIAVVAADPEYTFKPEMWPEVKNVSRPLRIPPGPRNPVGLFWIGLSLPGYGIHGTPNPELIGKTGSHGCIRLTNWDAVRLGGLVRIGMRVRFVQ